ncbi:MAG: DUF1593 domain-containing protein [Gemmataceae bacterium]|nr:DUF1593 domain-containing protein [Gemmataceae bacterium]
MHPCSVVLRVGAVLAMLLLADSPAAANPDRLRVIVETDAGGDPDDEQSLVRFLLYVSEWDVEGILCARPKARDKENRNPERTGLGIVRRLLTAYGECYPNLVKHDRRFPTKEQLWQRTVSGYDDSGAGVKLILDAVDRDDPRPVWFSNWGTDRGSAPSSLKLALDRVLKELGEDGYARFKARLRLSSDDQFGPHTLSDPPWKLWVDTFRPELEGKRWYHRFSALTARAGGFDLKRDVLTGHGPLGALYPTNTGLPQKEGDSMTFLYLVPTGMNDPQQPTWGSWAGRYGPSAKYPGKPYYWANQADTWDGTTHRDNSLKRWAVHLQNDFKARLDWCVARTFKAANHPPVPHCQGDGSGKILTAQAPAGRPLRLSAAGSSDPDGDRLSYRWYVYGECGTYRGNVTIRDAEASQAVLEVPDDAVGKTIHVILEVTDSGEPPLTRYRRLVVTARQAGAAQLPHADG